MLISGERLQDHLSSCLSLILHKARSNSVITIHFVIKSIKTVCSSDGLFVDLFTNQHTGKNSY